jgi:hypothetical protein
MDKFIGLWDLHCGWEYKSVGGERVIQPTMNEKAIKLAIDFAHDFKPNIILFGGDQINCAPVSHWNKGSIGKIGTFTLKDELDWFNDVVLGQLKFKNKVRRIWHRGNHEKWFEDVLDSNPGIRGLVSLESYLQLDKRGFEIYDYGEASRIGKLYNVHGDNIPGGINVARTAASRYGCNLRFGHYHTYQVYTLHNPIDNNDIKTAVSNPCLAIKGPSYGNNAPNTNINGWSFGYVQENGDFNDYVAVIANEKVVVEGRLYE